MSDVSDDLKEFLYFQIENIDRLRILLLMHKEQVEWRVEPLSARLYIKPDTITRELQILTEKGLITALREDSYLYSPDPRFHARVEELAKMDQEKPVTLINLVYERPADRLKSFADAFKLKKKDS